MLGKRLLGALPVNAVQALAGFGAIWAFTRLLSPEDYGRYALVLSAAMLAHTLALTWTEAAAFRFLPKARADGQARNHFATLLALAGAAALVAAGATACALAFLPIGASLAPAVLLAATSTFLRFLTRLARETDRADQCVRRHGVSESIYLLAGFAIGAALAVTTTLGPAAPFAGAVLAGLGVAAVDLPRLIAAARGGRIEVVRAARYARYGGPLALALAIDLATQATTRGLIAFHAGDAAVGAYAASFGLASRTLDLVFVWAGLACGPLLLDAHARGDVERRRRIAADMARTLLALAVPATVGLALIARPLAGAMVGEGLRDDVALLMPWIALAACCTGFATHYFSEAFQLGARTGLRALLMVAPAGLNVALCVVLLPRMGVLGAGIASLAAAGLAVVLLAMAGRRVVPLALPWRDALRTLVAALAMIPVVGMLPASGGWNEIFTKAAAGAIVYAAFAMALGVGGSRGLASALWRHVRGRLVSETARPA